MVYAKYIVSKVISTSDDSFESELLFEGAVASTGYGKFHIWMLMLVGLTYSATAVEITLVSFLIPSAKCDFEMTSMDAGLLTALPMLGMTIGSYLWGCIADITGRRWVMAGTLLMGGFCGLASSVSQYFSVFLALRCINGFALAGSLSICLPYLGEFHSSAIRERILSWMELFWTSGIITLPCLAWLIIPLDLELESKYFVLHSWNLFVAASSLPVIALGFWACTFPESPKFLMDRGEWEKALEVLKYIFTVNTGQDPSLFPLESLKEKGISFIDLDKIKEKKNKITFVSAMKKIGVITNNLFKPPIRKSTILACLVSYGLTASYYTLMMWFPEIFTRFEHYELKYPNMTSSVCEVASIFLEEEGCQDKIDMRVFLHTVILGLACIPTSLWYPLCVNRLGSKFIMMSCILVAGSVSMGMYFVTNSLQNLILACIFEAFTSLSVVTFYCCLVDLFPTNVRVMATGLTICCGRLGALSGNLLFGYLIDLNCVVPVVTFTFVLFGSCILVYFLPIVRHKAQKG